MRKNSKFIELETQKEIKEYIKDLKYSRGISKLQVHHMDLPNYDCWEQDLKRWGKDACLNRTNSLDSYGKSTWGSGASDGHGHYIAQTFSIFPNGHITTGRHINSTPIGIKGWNTGAICIEIYGDFDRGKDVITKAQAQAVIMLYALLAKKLDISINDKNIRPHCWFTASGTYLGGYYSAKSAKTCPGERFMGIGNTNKAFNTYFYPWIKQYLKDGSFPSKFGGKVEEPNKVPTPPKPATPTVLPGKYIVRYLQSCLNQNYGCKLAIDGSFGPATQSAVNKNYLNQGDKGEHVVWLQKALVNRGFNLNVDGSFGPATLKQLKAYQKSRGLSVDGCGGKSTHNAIIND